MDQRREKGRKRKRSRHDDWRNEIVDKTVEKREQGPHGQRTKRNQRGARGKRAKGQSRRVTEKLMLKGPKLRKGTPPGSGDQERGR